MPHDWQPTHVHDDRQKVNKAREAAEALFKPTKQIERTEVAKSASVTPSQVEHPAPRTPRIIAIPSTMSLADETVAPLTGSRPRSRRERSRRREKIPAAQHHRVRTLAQYGMTLAEVADFYRVSVDAIECIVGTGAEDTRR